MGVRPGRIEVHIEKLVLDGVGDLDARAVGDAIRHELQRMVDTEGLPVQETRASATAVHAPKMPSTLASDPRSVGRRVARSVHTSLGENT
jgi:hypothetical protein